ncbi:MAG: dephospho-CoA kinase [Candidatus Omnitrophica bacterium]|nr:dephospho-CoA kinase [Candidatus Omnitrophota bacterium]MDD5310735.1 dephospho-CoA kinase [Candidatus Omnitrophota bacterium]MDD5545581.1 dephospho-CoA kinase [Candidatus Omnitrophota bacterium]
MMIIIGVTGSIGTGKTTVSGMFRRMGAVVIDADEISHRLIYPGRPAWKRIVSAFGETILKRDHFIDRKALGRIVFSDSRKLKKLSGIIHPLVYKEIRGRIAKIKRSDPSSIVIVDVPLLLESGGRKHIDKLIVVTAPRGAQLKRSCGKFGISRSDVMRRIKAQMPLRDKVKAADFVIDNGGSIISTAKQSRAIWKKLVGA